MHPKPCFDPFVSDIGNYNWFKYQNLHPEDCWPGVQCVIWFPNLPKGDCLPGTACLYGL